MVSYYRICAAAPPYMLVLRNFILSYVVVAGGSQRSIAVPVICPVSTMGIVNPCISSFDFLVDLNLRGRAFFSFLFFRNGFFVPLLTSPPPSVSFVIDTPVTQLEVGSVSPKNTKAVLLKNIGDASLG